MLTATPIYVASTFTDATNISIISIRLCKDSDRELWMIQKSVVHFYLYSINNLPPQQSNGAL